MRQHHHTYAATDQTQSLHKQISTTVNRRRLLGAGAAAALTAGVVAGSQGRLVTAQDEGAIYHGAWPYQTPPNGHFNSFVANGIMNPPNIYGDLITLPMGLYYWASEEWLPLLATEWDFVDGENFEVTLRQGVTWSDGAPFTAEDVLTTFQILRLQSNTVWEYIDEITAVDDVTLRFHMSTPSTVVERYVIRASPRPAAVYGEWATRAQELFASGGTVEDPEGAQMLNEFNQFRPETLVANGPFTIDPASITNAELRMVKNETGYLADQVAFDQIRIFNGETDTISPIVLAGQVDYATHGFAPATEQQMIAQGLRIVRPPTFAGQALLINFDRLGAAFGDKRARQALAYMIDRAQNGIVSLADSGVPVRYMAGFSDQSVPQWMSEADIARLNTYERDLDQATALLQEAGWTKDGDRWQTPDGQPAAFDIQFPAELANQSASGLDLVDQFAAFGIELTPRSITFTQHPIDIDEGNFDLAIDFWGTTSHPHPHYSFVADLLTNNTLVPGGGISFPLMQETEVVGPVDLEELTIESALGLDEEAQRDNVTTIALAFNELLPIIPIYERYGNNPVLEGVRVAPWPPDDHPIYQNSPYADGIPTMLMLTGELQPV